MFDVVLKSSGVVIAKGVSSLSEFKSLAGREYLSYIKKVDIEPFAAAEVERGRRYIENVAETVRTLIGPTLPGERTDLAAKAETAQRIVSGMELIGDRKALTPEANDRGESVDLFAGLVAAKARWGRISALEISRLVNLKIDEIKAADLSTVAAIDSLIPSVDGFESDLRAAVADIQKKATVAYATAKLLLLNPEKNTQGYWTAAGKPSVDNLSDMVGFEVSAALRDAVWEIEGK